MRVWLTRVLCAWVVMLCCSMPLLAADPPAAGSEVPRPPLSSEEVADGWVSLFDGRTLFGWHPNSESNWRVEDGVIRADGDNKPRLLLTNFELADYEFRCEYRLAKRGNSGLFFRTIPSPETPADCYELNMCDSHPKFPTGSIVGHQKAAGTFSGEEQWRTMSARVEGKRITARLDGQQTVDFTDDSPSARRVGPIGLQVNVGRIEFRNICLRPLALNPIFDGSDLTGWHVVPGSKTRFEVVDGTIHAADGPGFLESDGTWGDFCLAFDARTGGPGVNSGVFFRTIRGTARAPSNGYELQIQNGFKNGDRSDPLDAGTGAIYRRTKARWVIPDERAWFTSTLIANGPHVSAWVNGVWVTDWTDTRPANANPRRGLRLEPGHLSLQGHDKTTDVSFRRLRAAEIPKQK
jgi:hypothetical protein